MLVVWASELNMPFTRRRSTPAAVGLTLLVLMHLAMANDLSYVSLFPKNLRPGSDFDVSVTLFHGGHTTLNVDVIAESSGAKLVSKTVTVDVSLKIGKRNTLIKLPIPDTALEHSYIVNISGTGAVKFVNSSTVTVIQKSLSLFVQTDKAVYKPGQTVLFRVVAIYPSMKPYKDWMDIVIYDKDRNRIAQWLKKKNDQGVFRGELILSDLTPLGTWAIEVKTKVDSTRKTFDVTEYVLPKFDVEVVLPSFYILYLNKPQLQPSLHITATARYTYGQPVKGTVKLTAKVQTFLTDDKQFTWMKTVNLVDGTASVEITSKELAYMAPTWLKESLFNGTVEAWTLLDGQTILATADVTETVTGVTLSANNTVTCYSAKYVLDFLDITPDSFKPGLPYTGYMVLKQKDGSSPILSDITLEDGRFREITITVTATQPFIWFGQFPFRSVVCSLISLRKTVPVTPSGYVEFDFDIESNCSVRIEALFLDISTNTNLTVEKTISSFESKALLGIQVTLGNVESSIKPGDVVQLKVQTTVITQSLYYMVMSKGAIIISDMVTNVNAASYTIRLNVNHELAQKLSPTARCVVFYVADNSEIISDSIEFNIDGAFANNVSLSFDKDKVEPGTNVSLTIHGSPHSTAYVLVVDQSVLLVKEGNDITQNMVLDDLRNYENVASRGFNRRPFFSFWPFPSGGKDSIEVFESAMLGFMTDGYVHKKEFTDDGIIFRRKDNFPIAFMSGEGSSISSPPIAVRMNFPETWCFEDVDIGASGNGSIDVVAPDTITSWIASGFAVSDKDGLGIAPLTSKLTVFRKFFISMILPYSIIRGEVFALSATVFNYMETNLKVRVVLKASAFFYVGLENQTVTNTDVAEVIEVPKNDAITVVMWINATKLGQIPVEVWAYAGVAGDAERRMLLVVPEGIKQRYSTSMLIDNTKGKNDFESTVHVTLPSAYLVPDSARLEITVFGDIMGRSITGLDKLIQMPYGCGEQTMLALGPNVFILDYLNATGTLTPDVETKCKGYILSGYQRELTFQRNDGSFSAFGNSDAAGSVWLSSFVVHCFHKAKVYIPVDDEKLAIALKWILLLQNPNGSFTEPPNGRVIHTDMQGGSSKGVALTASVVVTLLESRDNKVIDKKLLSDSIAKACVYLEQQLDSINDSYSLCLISYALTLANSPTAALALSKRDALAIVENDLKHWEKIEPLAATGSFIPPYQQSSAINIEMTSYALMTYNHRKDAIGAVPVAKWLIKQRNPEGGFVSTQDTVMALQALAEFAEMMYASPDSFNIKVNAMIGQENHDFDPITSENMLTMLGWEPTTTTGDVQITAKGYGVCLVQVSVFYNVYKVDESNGFSLSIGTVVKDGGNTVVVKTCKRWTREDRKCGMALETVQLLSGYSFLGVEEVGTISGLIKKIETDPISVYIYYDTLNESTLCVSVTMTRAILVNNLKNATIKVLEYYNPGNFVIGTYGLN